MKKLLLLLLVVSLYGVFARLPTAEGHWLTDLPQAQAQAKKESKLVFLDFTGSDWCPGCKIFRQNILTERDFIAFAETNLVLVEIDFPEKKPQSEELRKANAKLHEDFKIEAFPTVVILDDTGKEVFRESGFDGGALPDYLAKLKKLRKR